MKNILVATDFSANATHAAEYAYRLAKELKTNIMLCNAFAVPVEMPQASLVVWDKYEKDEITESINTGLDLLKEHLQESEKGAFQPALKCISEPGALQDVLGDIVIANDVGLIIMGTHKNGGLSTLILGNHSRYMVDQTTVPLLLIPPSINFTPIKKIAFASDLTDVTDDLEAIYNLIEVARLLNAEILLTYVFDESTHSTLFERHLNSLLVQLSNKANYGKIYYRLVKNRSVENGLDWLCGYGHVDMLAMVHRKRNLFARIFEGSHTQHMAGHIQVPLLVFSEKTTPGQ